MKPVNLMLGDDDEDHPRYLLMFPSGQVVAYGGEDGSLSLIEERKNDRMEVRVIRHYDDAIRAVAVSENGKRVAVGFETGDTRIYSFEDYDMSSEHPFLRTRSEEEGEVAPDAFLSQADDFLGENDNENCWALPQAPVPIRHLKFYPSSVAYLLSVATEGGLFIVNATSEAAISKRYLEELVEKNHDLSGIRGAGFLSHPNSPSTVMASLGMDGRACLWNVSDLHSHYFSEEDNKSQDEDKSPLQIKCYREKYRCMPNPDVGEQNGATASDRASLPLLFRMKEQNVLALPGKPRVQLRAISLINDEVVVEEVEGSTDQDKGHIEPIVAMDAWSSSQYLATSGQDGRVILWSVVKEEVRSFGLTGQN